MSGLFIPEVVVISTNDFRIGLTIELDGEIYSVVDFQHVKPGKGSALSVQAEKR